MATTPPSRRLFPEEKPFDPLGVQLGAFLFRPAMEYSRGWDSNPARNATAPAQSSWFNIYSPELLINSNWAVHEFNATIRGGYTTYDTMHQLDRPNVDAKAVARIDVTSQSRIDLEGRYLLFTDNPGSPNIQVGLSHLPIAHTYGGTAGVGHRVNRLDVSLKGSFDRTVYNDSEFTDGTSDSNADRNYNRYGLVLRTSYEVNPGVRPFIELGADRRQYDLAIDAGGVMRTSQGSYGKAGTTLELRPKLTGELAVGYLSRSYFDQGLTDIRGYTFDATLTWLATALTTVKLTSTTTVAESTLVGVSGQFTRETALQVDHAFRRWLDRDAQVHPRLRRLRRLAARGLSLHRVLGARLQCGAGDHHQRRIPPGMALLKRARQQLLGACVVAGSAAAAVIFCRMGGARAFARAIPIISPRAQPPRWVSP